MHRKYSIIFKGETEPELDWSFEPVQDNVTVHAGEPALMFYKTYNKTEKPLVGRPSLKNEASLSIQFSLKTLATTSARYSVSASTSRS